LFLASVAVVFDSPAQTSSGDGVQPELTLDIEHLDRMGGTFALVSATYQLDGQELLRLQGAELQDRLSGPRLTRAPLPPGLHVIGMRLIYIGHSEVFKYVERYQFTMQGYLLVESRAGYGVKVISSARERKSLTVQWQNRPTFQLGGLPKKAILSVKLSPGDRDLRGRRPASRWAPPWGCPGRTSAESTSGAGPGRRSGLRAGDAQIRLRASEARSTGATASRAAFGVPHPRARQAIAGGRPL